MVQNYGSKVLVQHFPVFAVFATSKNQSFRALICRIEPFRGDRHKPPDCGWRRLQWPSGAQGSESSARSWILPVRRFTALSVPEVNCGPTRQSCSNVNGRKPAQRKDCDHLCEKGVDFRQHLHVNPGGSNALELPTGKSGMTVFGVMVKKNPLTIVNPVGLF